MTPAEALDQAIQTLGSQTALADAIGVKTGHIFYWKKSGKSVPAEHAVAIDRATAGKVHCEDLCPDVDWAHIRSTSGEHAPAVLASEKAA